MTCFRQRRIASELRTAGLIPSIQHVRSSDQKTIWHPSKQACTQTACAPDILLLCVMNCIQSNCIVVQACRKVRPFLEQAAAAAAAAANTEGTAKAQAAAKKAKKLTPEEMKKMRQQADPNYQAKQAAAGTPTPYADGPSKKGKKAKTAAGQPEAASVTASKAARHKLPDAGSKPGGAASTHMAAQTAAQAQADQSAASNNKRRQGLGFAEEQPQPKRAKPTPPDPAAADNTDSVQHAQQAPANSNPQEKLPSSKVVDEQPSQTKAGLQKQSAAPQAAGASSGPPRRHQPAAAAAAAQQGPLAVFTDECTAFVRGLDNKVTEAELKQLLAACGQVKDVRLVMDKATGRPKVSACQQCPARQPCIVQNTRTPHISLSCNTCMLTSARGDAHLLLPDNAH